MSLFRKDFSIFGTKEKKTIPIPQPAVPSPQRKPSQPPPPPPPPKRQQILHRPEIVHHSTLFLLDKYGMSQEPPGLWKNKMVYETPASKSEGSRTVFDPDSPARQAEHCLRREIKARKAEREARSLEEGWLEGPAQSLARSLEDIEDIRCELRDAGHWENTYLEVRERRKENARVSWFGKELEEERKCRLVVAAGLRSVRAPEWTHEFEPPTAAQLESSAASIRSQRRTSVVSFSTTSAMSPKENRFSMLSMTTTRSTPRSSIMSMTQASTVSSPTSSGMPSPALSAWKEEATGEPSIEKASHLSLPPPLVSFEGGRQF